jgi:hypothetical protein
VVEAEDGAVDQVAERLDPGRRQRPRASASRERGGMCSREVASAPARSAAAKQAAMSAADHISP